VLRRERGQAALGLRQLSLAADTIPAPRLVPRNSDVHESLEEVPLLRAGRAPGVLQRLVRGEVLAPPDLVQPELEPVGNEVRPRS